jgi:hypothetical protein
LLVAAAAELTVLHMDKDFEVIAAITGQPLERLDRLFAAFTFVSANHREAQIGHFGA